MNSLISDFKFSAGNYDRFLGFIKNLSKKDSVALITHTDLDGIASGKVTYHVVSQIVKPKFIRFVGYDEINNDFVNDLKKKKINKVIFSDLAIDDIKVIKEIEKFADILLIDHHLFNEDFNSKKTVFINIQGFCAGYLCYTLFSEFDREKILDKIDWLVACSCISDWMYFNNQEFMSKVFKKYGDKFEILNDKTDFGGIRKSGKFWDLQWELSLALIYFKRDISKVFDKIGIKFGDVGDLKKYSKLVNNELKRILEDFERGKEVYDNIYLWELKNEKYPLRSIVSTLSAVKHPDKFVLVLMKKGDKYIVSGRRQDKKENVKELVEKLMIGLKDSFAGGHVAAGGGHFLAKDLDKFKENLRKYSSKKLKN